MLTLLACAILTSALAAPFVGPEKVTELNASTAATNASAGSKHEHVGEATRTNKPEVAHANAKTGGLSGGDVCERAGDAEAGCLSTRPIRREATPSPASRRARRRQATRRTGETGPWRDAQTPRGGASAI